MGGIGNALLGMLLNGRAQESGVKRRGSDATLLLIYNAHHDVVNFTLPSVPEGRHWQGLIDTNRPDSQLAGFNFGDVYAVTGRSLLALGLATGHVEIGHRALYDRARGPISRDHFPVSG